jgi:hypothetical protein
MKLLASETVEQAGQRATIVQLAGHDHASLEQRAAQSVIAQLFGDQAQAVQSPP